MQQLAEGDGALLLGLDAPARTRPAPHVRDRQRVAQWNIAVHKVTGHRLERAATPDEVARIEAEHAEEMRRGPAFARMRRGCLDDAPPAISDRNQLDRLVRWFTDADRELYKRDLAWAKHEGRTLRRTVARTARAVLIALVSLAKRFGQVFPSLARIAGLALCCRRTVASVLGTLEALGIVARVRRRKTITTAYGRRQVQDCNAYLLRLPNETPAAAAARLSAAQGRPDALVFQSANIAEQNPKDRGKSETPPRDHAQKWLGEGEVAATPMQLVPNEPPEQTSQPLQPLPKVVTTAVDWQAISRSALEAKRARLP